MRSLLILTAVLLFSTTVGVTQEPATHEFKVGDFMVRLKNVAVVVGTPTAGGELPEKPISSPSQQLLPPGAMAWITFDYETDFKKSDAPEGSQFLAIGLEIPPGKFWGYGPAGLDQPSGKGAVRLHLNHMLPSILEVNEKIKLNAYSRRNNGENIQVADTTEIPVKCRIDGTVTLSLTQFAEIQATIKRVAELEKRLKRLEKNAN